MDRSPRRALVILAISSLWSIAPLTAQEPIVAGEAADLAARYRNEIRPILQGRCVKCHGPEKKKGGIDFSLPG